MGKPLRPPKSTLRVLLNAAPDADRADAWALFDAHGRVMKSGNGTPDAWPASECREAVLAAARVRIVGLHLPPLSADRVAAAASFALEDQLAGPAAEQHIAVSLQRPDGTVEAIVANRQLIASLVKDFDRVLAEPALAPRPAQRHWCWYPSGAGGGFVRKPDGTAFATSEQRGVPAELGLALDHAVRAGGAPAEVDTAFDMEDAIQAELKRHVGTAFVPTERWRWDAAGHEAFAGATDLRQGEFARRAPTAVREPLRIFRMAATVAALAIVLHIVASIGEWATLRVEIWRTRSALATLARDAGVTGTGNPAVEIAARHAQARHSAGLAAPADALPLLARAAPALAALPSGMLKTAAYADGHWTFDLAKPDAGTASRLERQLTDAGLATLQATNASGVRMRVSLEAGAL